MAASHLETGGFSKRRSTNIEELLRTVASLASQKLTYTKEDLTALGISLSFSSFHHMTDESRFFQPISAADLAKYNANEDWFEGDDEQPSQNDRETYRVCMDVVHALQFRHDSLNRGKKGHRLADVYKWTPITIENSFFHNGEQSARPPASTGAGCVDTSLEEWILPGDNDIPEPHIRIITISSGVPESNQLLVSELSAIMQVLSKRVHQPELREITRFPVLLISLFGPCSGRVIQALYNAGQDDPILTPSDVLSLMGKNPPASAIILRFMASKPQLQGQFVVSLIDPGEFYSYGT